MFSSIPVQESIFNFLSAVSLLVPLKLSERHLTILYIANINVYGVLLVRQINGILFWNLEVRFNFFS